MELTIIMKRDAFNINKSKLIWMSKRFREEKELIIKG
jgi:hypothetical protein